MRLSRMALDVTKRRTMLALSSPSIFHGTVEGAFCGEKKRKLWRIDELRGNTYLMILSEDEPDLTRASADLGYEGKPWESKDYASLLERINDGTVWHFRLCANPTYSKSIRGERGKVHAHKTTEHQMAWLIRQGRQHGFEVTEESFAVIRSRWYQFNKGNRGGKEVKLLAVTYEGTLSVTDSELFRKTLQEGIGREKAYGMGLMTLMSMGC